MYPSIPDDLTKPAVNEYLDSRVVDKPSTDRVMKLMDVVGRSNYFELGPKLFHQTGGSSIGRQNAFQFADCRLEN